MKNYIEENNLIEVCPSTINERAVVRLPQSLHREKTIMRNITLEELHAPFEEVVAERKAISNENAPFSIKEDVSTQPSAPSSPNYALYLSSTVCGIKNRCIPILVYRKSYDYEEHIKRLMKKFSIDSFYLLETEEFIFGLSLKSISLERYVRIMKHSKSCNRSMLIRFKQEIGRASCRERV